MPTNKILSWMVHLYTATGGVIGMFALLLAADNRTSEAFLVLISTLIIDATDGMIARRLRVSEVLPEFSGAQMDNVIDVFTYIWIPVFIMVHEDLLPHPIMLAIPVFAAMYAYGQVEMKTPDSFFLGFPSYWNVIALYLYLLKPDAWLATILVVVPAILTFIPTRYLYPSKSNTLWRTSWGLGMIWVVMVMFMLLQDDPSSELIWASTFYPIFYLGASFYVDWRVRTGRLIPSSGQSTAE